MVICCSHRLRINTVAAAAADASAGQQQGDAIKTEGGQSAAAAGGFGEEYEGVTEHRRSSVATAVQ